MKCFDIFKEEKLKKINKYIALPSETDMSPEIIFILKRNRYWLCDILLTVLFEKI